jgi:molecular chaperone HtpG
MQTGKIGVTTENIFPIIKKFLYSDHEIFLRELVSNAVDATQKLKNFFILITRFFSENLYRTLLTLPRS